MNSDKPVTKKEFDNAISRIDENFADLRGDLVGLEERIQVQFDVLHKDLISKIDFLIEQSQRDHYDQLETQVVDHEQRISKLEVQLPRTD